MTASTGGAGAAIGGADYGTAKVTIRGGVVKATAAGNGRGIGGGGKLSSDSSTVTLGYYDTTGGTIRVYASSYSGTVTLEEPFAWAASVGGEFTRKFYPGVVNDNSKLGGGYLTLWGGGVYNWADLQMALSGAGLNAVIQLKSKDIYAESGDTFLTVPAGQVITLDLNGRKIDRSLNAHGASAKDDGYVIKVEEGATLTIIDSSDAKTGTITGGNTSGDVGGIRNEGTLTIEGARSPATIAPAAAAASIIPAP